MLVPIEPPPTLVKYEIPVSCLKKDPVCKDPDRSGVHIQGIAVPPESTLHPNQGSCSAHS